MLRPDPTTPSIVIFNDEKAFKMSWGRLYQVNNSVIFNRRSIGPVKFLIQMVEALGIIIDRRPKERPKKKVDK